jgi:hypothetical protein
MQYLKRNLYGDSNPKLMAQICFYPIFISNPPTPIYKLIENPHLLHQFL